MNKCSKCGSQNVNLKGDLIHGEEYDICENCGHEMKSKEKSKIVFEPPFDYDKNNVWHVYPTNDVREHEIGTYKKLICSCNPTIEIQSNGGLIIKHNAWDRREINEPDNKLFKKVN